MDRINRIYKIRSNSEKKERFFQGLILLIM